MYWEWGERRGNVREPEGSLYIPTPDRPRTVMHPIDLPARLCFIELSHLGSFVSTVNQIRTCTTSGCKGNIAPVAVKCRRLGVPSPLGTPVAVVV